MVHEYDWHYTKPLGWLGNYKVRHQQVWCPLCNGSGVIVKEGLLFTKTVTCQRCHGKMMVPARTIRGLEKAFLWGYERELVDKVSQYPIVRKPAALRKGATLSDNKTVENVKKRYCVLQFKIVTMQDQQGILLRELEELKQLI